MHIWLITQGANYNESFIAITAVSRKTAARIRSSYIWISSYALNLLSMNVFVLFVFSCNSHLPSSSPSTQTAAKPVSVNMVKHQCPVVLDVIFKHQKGYFDTHGCWIKIKEHRLTATSVAEMDFGAIMASHLCLPFQCCPWVNMVNLSSNRIY